MGSAWSPYAWVPGPQGQDFRWEDGVEEGLWQSRAMGRAIPPPPLPRMQASRGSAETST